MEKSKVLSALEECGVIAVIRAENDEKAQKIIDACVQGGIRGIEVTYTVPGATQIISNLAKKYANTQVIIGAGTVLDGETARQAILAGANFVVSPYLNTDMVKTCNRYQVAVMAGAMTVKEAAECMEAGADIVKIFPGNLLDRKSVV